MKVDEFIARFVDAAKKVGNVKSIRSDKNDDDTAFFKVDYLNGGLNYMILTKEEIRVYGAAILKRMEMHFDA